MQIDIQHERHLAILRDAGHDVEPYVYNSGLLQEKLKNGGILYPNNRMKYSIDEKLSAECFTIYARFLDITDGEKPQCWRWVPDPHDFGMELAIAVNVKWLEVKGNFWTMGLSPGGRYQVCFRVKLEPNTNMRGETVNLRLSLPNGTSQVNQAALPTHVDKWTDVVAGSFEMTETMKGMIGFAMERVFKESKRGLVIKGAVIKRHVLCT